MVWFEADKTGLRKIAQRRGSAWLLYELVANALDAGSQNVRIEGAPVAGRPLVALCVEDDGEGFANLAHAWTLFAESARKGESEKRGRFNLGEKLVLALCATARITTTTGEVVFDENGRRGGRARRAKGSLFEALVAMTRAEWDECAAAVSGLLVPPGVHVSFNGSVIESREPRWTLLATLPTEHADDEGVLRRTTRSTKVAIYEPRDGETPMIYELGIPVQPSECRYHLDVGQKCPLTMERDSVPPTFLRTLHTIALNASHHVLEEADATQPWVRSAAGDERSLPEAREAVLDLRFGPKRVAYDPNDTEANKLAMAEGYTVVPGGSLSADEWARAKEVSAILPASKVTPSHMSNNGTRPPNTLSQAEWTPGMHFIVARARELARELLGVGDIHVRIVREPMESWAARFGGLHLTFNMGRLGRRWFDQGGTAEVDSLLVHEFGHHFSPDHFSSSYLHAVTDLGAKLARVAVRRRDLFPRDGSPAMPKGAKAEAQRSDA